MDAGTRVKNRNGDKGTITGKVHRPLPADEANEKDSLETRITHWSVKWDLTGVESMVRAEEVTPLASFSDPDLRTLETKFEKKTVDEDEFIVRIQDTAITFKAQDGHGIELEFMRANHTAYGGSYQNLESALRRIEEYEKGHWTPFTPE